MKTLLIPIKGRKVRCRALKDGMIRKFGDMYLDGTPISPRCIGQKDAWDTYRPIPAKRKAKRAGKVKAFKAWGCVRKATNTLEPMIWNIERMAYIWAGITHRVIPVTITPAATGKKK